MSNDVYVLVKGVWTMPWLELHISPPARREAVEINNSVFRNQGGLPWFLRHLNIDGSYPLYSPHNGAWRKRK